MPVKNEKSIRFVDELKIIPYWAYLFAMLALLVAGPALGIAHYTDKNAPPLWVLVPMGVIAGFAVGVYIMLIGYVNRDAGRRGMSRALWTIVAIFIPNALGILLYFILRKPRVATCPQCRVAVGPEYSFCPRCRHRLGLVCPHCQRSVNEGDVFCPYCGAELGSAPQPASASSKE